MPEDASVNGWKQICLNLFFTFTLSEAQWLDLDIFF